MKLVIQIPCYNEEVTLPGTLADLPREVPGFDSVEWLVIDDGSTDRTVELARAHGVDHIVQQSHNQGLAAAFMAGLEAALKAGADVIVNTDGDNQYRAACIPALTAPILERRAQIVVGARPISTIAHFSPVKRALQRLGSWVVRRASGADVDDAPSGFRAIHRDAATQLYVFDRYTYTLETVIQAGRLGIPLVSVPVEVNGPTRESRLMRSVAQYILRSTKTILRIAVLYRPLRFFAVLAAIIMLPGIAAFIRFLVFYATGEGSGHVQSLVIGAALIAAGSVVFVGGLVADLIAANRVLSADIRSRLLKAELDRAGR
ncbi:glycosyltransferase family 2 protein [Histidinibacterium aquaticum]|uniref:Glycosyltransferase family 2 protein n=1 Tax=Histidinibacterium aquaticum TaxID=2613962 RepID=A0A5J5GPU6_9RHOB|nr:glycosyltransferase family 2 protein [Histidinibacterium aquaticum]KAA9010396.1 glycosyltransferase family 2 protein [Histidinibacterium aquaticum]